MIVQADTADRLVVTVKEELRSRLFLRHWKNRGALKCFGNDYMLWMDTVVHIYTGKQKTRQKDI